MRNFGFLVSRIMAVVLALTAMWQIEYTVNSFIDYNGVFRIIPYSLAPFVITLITITASLLLWFRANSFCPASADDDVISSNPECVNNLAKAIIIVAGIWLISKSLVPAIYVIDRWGEGFEPTNKLSKWSVLVYACELIFGLFLVIKPFSIIEIGRKSA